MTAVTSMTKIFHVSASPSRINFNKERKCLRKVKAYLLNPHGKAQIVRCPCNL